MIKKLVYICSPCRGDYEKNINNAARYSRVAMHRGYIPITPHLYFTRFMNDADSKERSLAMDAGLQLLLMCSEVWVFGLDHPSEGMQAEIAFAIRNGKPIKDGMKMIEKTIGENHTRKEADSFRSLQDMFKNAHVQLVEIREEDGKCHRTGTTKVIKTLQRPKR